MSNFIGVTLKLPKILKVKDIDRKTLMQGLRESSKLVSQQAKRLCSNRTVSKPGEIPGKHTGRLRRNIKNHASKRKNKFWSRTQVDTIKDAQVFYPAVLFYGKKDRTLLPRQNPIIEATKLVENKTSYIIEEAIIDSIKGFGS